MSDTLYRGPVHVRIQRPAGSNASPGWQTLKAGFSGLELIVTRDAIRVRAVGRIAHSLIGGMEPEFDPRLSTMAIERIGVFGSNIAERDSVVVSCTDLDGQQQVALRPQTGSIADLWKALQHAGVQPLSSSP